MLRLKTKRNTNKVKCAKIIYIYDQKHERWKIWITKEKLWVKFSCFPGEYHHEFCMWKENKSNNNKTKTEMKKFYDISLFPMH